MCSKPFRATMLALLIIGILTAVALTSSAFEGKVITNEVILNFEDENLNKKTSLASNSVVIMRNPVVAAGFTKDCTAENILSEGEPLGVKINTAILGESPCHLEWAPCEKPDSRCAGARHFPGDAVALVGSSSCPSSKRGLLTSFFASLPDAINKRYFSAMEKPTNARGPIVGYSANKSLDVASIQSSAEIAGLNKQLDADQDPVIVQKTPEIANPTPLQPFDFTVAISNHGAGQVDDVVLTDLLADEFNFRGPVMFDADGPGNPFSPVEVTGAYYMGSVTVNIGSLATGTTVTVSFEVEVTGEIPAWTTIFNVATVSYDDWQSNHYSASGFTEVTVKAKGGVNIEASANVYASPGDLLQFPFSIENTGNGADSMRISAMHSGTLGLTWNIYWDSDKDGEYETLVSTTSASNNGIWFTESIPKDDVFNYVAKAAVPVWAADASYNKVVIWAASGVPPAPYPSDSITLINTVRSPKLTMIKQVDKAYSIPGEILTYTLTVTNIGTGDATAILLEDNISPIKDCVDFVGGSIRVDDLVQSDAIDSDYADFTADVIRVRISLIGGTLTASAKRSFVISFQLRVK